MTTMSCCKRICRSWVLSLASLGEIYHRWKQRWTSIQLHRSLSVTLPLIVLSPVRVANSFSDLIKLERKQKMTITISIDLCRRSFKARKTRPLELLLSNGSRKLIVQTCIPPLSMKLQVLSFVRWQTKSLNVKAFWSNAPPHHLYRCMRRFQCMGSSFN